MNIEEQIRLLARAVVELQEGRCQHCDYCGVDIPLEMTESPRETQERLDRERIHDEALLLQQDKRRDERNARQEHARLLAAQGAPATEARRQAQVARAQAHLRPDGPGPGYHFPKSEQ